MKVGFIGFGRMGSALSEGAVAAGGLRKSDVIAFDPSSNARIKRNGFNRASSISDLVRRSNLIFLCVKPQGMQNVLDEISSQVLISVLKKKCFVSIAAGIGIGRLEKNLGRTTPVLRVMPNTPALLRAGMSGLSKGTKASAAQVKVVKNLLSSVGDVAVIPERLMDALTAVSGSGPAYFFYLAESMMQAAQKLGFSKDVARLLVHQTAYGAGQMLKAKAESAEELRRQVTSPGGTTEAALKEFMKKGFQHIIGSGLQKAVARSRQLA